MELYLDTSDVAAVKKLARIFPLAGVTTNPSIVAAGKTPLDELLPALHDALGGKGRLFAQVMATTAEGMVEDARKLRAMINDLVVKVPVTAEGLAAIKMLKAEGIPPEEDLVHYCLKYLMVSLCRIQGGAQLRLSLPSLSETLQPAVQRAASAILDLFCGPLVINDEERLYFASIIGNRTPLPPDEALASADWLRELVDDMLNNILNLCKVDFRSDAKLRIALMTHLYASFSRYYLKPTLPNPLMTLIKSQYVEAYNYSLIGCEMLKEKHHLAINDDDIG